MKTIYTNLFICFCILTVCVSCDDFLQEEALDTYTSENFPQTAEDAEALVNQAYNLAGDLYGSYYYMDICYATEFANTRWSGPGNYRSQLDEYTVNNSNTSLTDTWQRAYQTIKQTNVVIEATANVDSSNPDSEAFNRINAEAKALRAYVYYDLMIIFGEVPLILNRLQSLEDAANSLAPISDIYDAVIQDLTEAEPVLPHEYPSDDLGRVTRGAVRALLGNVYLQRAMDPAGVSQADDIDNAVSWLRQVVDAADGGKVYTLEPDFENLFGLQSVNDIKYSNEVIFQFWRDVNPCCRLAFYSNPNPQDTPFGSGWGHMVAEVPFYLSFENEDERLQVSFFDTLETEDKGTVMFDHERPWADNYQHDGPAFQKWIDPNHDNTGANNNVIIIRYAEVLLNLSEALLRQAGAPTQESLDLLNQVRNRAKLGDLNPAPSTFEEMEEAIFNELRWETHFEANGMADAHRFFDIFKERVESNALYEQPPVPEGVEEDPDRLNDASPGVPITVTLDNIRMPIPLVEIDANPALQEPDSGE